jgi:tetratricopeptide (TPR) repeat protein
MLHWNRSCVALLFSVFALAAGPCLAAENAGQAELDKATQMKVTASSAGDLSEVITLCEAALEKGLDKGNTEFAKSILAAACVDRGTIRAQAGRADTALKDFDKAIEADPKNPLAYERKGLVLAAQKKYDEALATLDKGAKASPDLTTFPIQKARVYSAKSEPKSALEELIKALAIEPENIGVLLLRAGVYQELNERQKALDDVDKVLQLKPETSAAARSRAMLLSELGKHEDALSELEKLHKAEPKDPVTLLQLGVLYSAYKKPAKAVEAFTALLKDHPGEWAAYRGRGDAELGLGRRLDAIRDYNRGLQLQPKDPGILNNLAWVLATAPEKDLRDGQRAVVLATEACKVSNYQQSHILSTLAAAHAENGDFILAVEWATKAVELGSKEHGEQLKKELESYKARKPWRENLPGDKKPEEKPALETKTEEKKTDDKKPEEKKAEQK